MKYLSILVGKFVLIAGKILHRGSSLPGMLALKIDKKILSKLKYPPIKLIVTGSSGKGSTDRKSTRLNSSHHPESRMPSSA